MFKFKNNGTRLTSPERHQWGHFGVFAVQL